MKYTSIYYVVIQYESTLKLYLKLQQKLISRYSCLSGEPFDKVLNIKSYYALEEIEVTGVYRRKEI